MSLRSTFRSRVTVRPPGYRRGRQVSTNARSWLAAWRTFMGEGKDSPTFQSSLRTLEERGVLYEPKVPRYWQLYQLAEAFIEPGSAVAEFGVYRGGTARLLADVAARRAPGLELHLFDTFAGMPDAAAYDYAEEVFAPGDLADTDEAEVRELLTVEEVRPIIWKGPFSETLPSVGSLPPLSLTHVDADLHDSVLEACAWAYPRTQAGGLIVFDDYAAPDCPGATRAVREFFAERPENPILLPTGQAIVVREHEG